MICSVFSFASVAFVRVSVTLSVPSLIPTGRTVTFLRDLGQF